MRPLRMILVALPATILLARAPGERANGQSVEIDRPSPVSQPQPSLPEGPQPVAPEAEATDLPLSVDAIIEPATASPFGGFLGYRYESSSFDWILGEGDQLGTFSLVWEHYQRSGVNHGIGVGLEFHFLNGPVRTDMPPRVFDFSIGYQHRDRLGVFGYDAAVSVVASSDFEGNSREGIRLPSHAVGFLAVCPTAELVFGIDYLDRGDVKLLPVVGLIAVPHPDVRLEVVFPRPRLVLRLTDTHRLYVAGELGGGTWAVERTTMVDDLATYRDLRLSVGLQCLKEDHRRSALEIGYLFDRRLEYTSGNGDYRPNETAMIRLVETF